MSYITAQNQYRAVILIIKPESYDINYNLGYIKRSRLFTAQLLMGNFNDFTAYGYEVLRELGANRGAGRIAYLAREIDSEQLVVIKQFQFAQGSGWDGHTEIDRELDLIVRSAAVPIQVKHLPYIKLAFLLLETISITVFIGAIIE